MDCRERAEYCRRMARQVAAEDIRNQWTSLADMWLAIAAQREGLGPNVIFLKTPDKGRAQGGSPAH